MKKDVLDKMYVTFQGADFELSRVQRYFDEKHSGELGNLEKGNKIKARGFVKGLMMNVQVDDCELVK